MIRRLVIVAGVSAIVAIAALSGAFALGGQEALDKGGWTFSDRGFRWLWTDRQPQLERPRRIVDGSGPQETRTLPWAEGDDFLALDVPADVRVVQKPGQGEVSITGPAGAVRQIRIERGLIHFKERVRTGDRLDIRVTASGVRRFELSGSNSLTLVDYDQPRLQIDATGGSSVTAHGTAGVVELYVSGSGRADLADLATDGAEIETKGEGKAVLSPARWADIRSSGSSRVTLTREPGAVDMTLRDAAVVDRPGQAGMNRKATPLLQ